MYACVCVLNRFRTPCPNSTGISFDNMPTLSLSEWESLLLPILVVRMKFPKTFSCTGCGSKPRLLGMLSMTASFMLVELIVGNLTNSMALIADSFHMLSDVISLVREGEKEPLTFDPNLIRNR